jgi:hypothetical protein
MTSSELRLSGEQRRWVDAARGCIRPERLKSLLKSLTSIHSRNALARADFRRCVDERLADHDAPLLSTVPIITPLLQGLDSDEGYASTNQLALRNPAMTNLPGSLRRLGTRPRGQYRAGWFNDPGRSRR